MKYQAKIVPELKKWAVCSGKSYYPNTLTESKNHAIKQACIMSARWHQSCMDECQAEYEKIRTLEGSDDMHEWGDEMA